MRISTKGLMAKGVPAANVSTSRMICGEMTGYTDVQSCFQMGLGCVWHINQLAVHREHERSNALASGHNTGCTT